MKDDIGGNEESEQLNKMSQIILLVMELGDGETRRSAQRVDAVSEASPVGSNGWGGRHEANHGPKHPLREPWGWPKGRLMRGSLSQKYNLLVQAVSSSVNA